MTRISPRHPRYRSLTTRAALAAASREGIVVPEGLIAHGRAEAFDYLLGERTIPSARRATRLAANWILRARRPVLSVNGNVAALASAQIAELVRIVPALRVEVNLFHRTPERVRAIADRLRSAGLSKVYGLRPTGRIPHLPSDRALVDREGIARADLCIVPLEDGDRTTALRRFGMRVIAIDLNPLSRTARQADLTIVDELTRALAHLADDLRRAKDRPRAAPARVSNDAFLTDALARLRRSPRSTRRPLRPRPRRAPRGRSGGRPRSGTDRR